MTKNGTLILYLTYDGLTDPLGQSQILPYLVGLSQRGYFFTVISFEKAAEFESKKQTIEGICMKSNITWIPQIYHKNPPIMSTVYDLWVLYRVVSRLLKSAPFKIIHCRSYLTALIGLRMKEKRGVKFVFDMRGFWADERVDGGIWALKNPLYRFVFRYFKAKEKSFLNSSDHVISLTETAKNYLLKHFEINEKKVTVIPCSVDLDLFNPRNFTDHERSALRKKLGLDEGDFVVLYLGSLGTWYMYSEMVTAFEALKKTKPNAKFLFVTPDGDKVERRNDFLVAKATRSQVPLYCSLAQVAIMFIKPSFSKMASSATKMAEVMAMGVPVVTNRGWGDVEIFAHQCEHIQFDTIKPLAQENPPIQKITDFAVEQFSLDGAINGYQNVYEETQKKA